LNWENNGKLWVVKDMEGSYSDFFCGTIPKLTIN